MYIGCDRVRPDNTIISRPFGKVREKSVSQNVRSVDGYGSDTNGLYAFTLSVFSSDGVVGKRRARISRQNVGVCKYRKLYRQNHWPFTDLDVRSLQFYRISMNRVMPAHRSDR